MRPNPVWSELVQLVPVITLAFPIIVRGEVALAQLAPAFMVAAVLAALVSGFVLWRDAVLNPILVGTGVWLATGAIGFGAPVAPLARMVAETQALGLFVCALAVGIAALAYAPQGAIGARHSDTAWVRRASLWLVGAMVAAVAWAWFFRDDVRLGGGLPFIALNIFRRVTIAREMRR